LSFFHQVAQNPVGLRVLDHGAPGKIHHQIGSVFSVLSLAPAGLAVGGEEERAEIAIEETGHVAERDQNDVPSFPPSASVRTAARNILFPSETDAAVSSMAGADAHVEPIDELIFHAGRAMGRMEATLLEPRRSKSTVPSIRAKRVLSRARATFLPGKI
jgi:hypothetical protein